MPDYQAVGISQVRAAFDDVFDQAVLFGGFTGCMRDYDVLVCAAAGPRAGIRPEYLRYRFTCCARAAVTSALPPPAWKRSLDERLTGCGQGNGLDGYVRGVQWQELYPGMRLVPGSAGARRWAGELGIPFREAFIAVNARVLTLVFSDLAVDVIDPGHGSFAVPAGGPDGKIPVP